MSTVVLYYNPDCSKSRQTLQLLEEKGISPTTVDYLKSPPSTQQLKSILALLGISAIELIRQFEAPFKDLGLSQDSTEKTLLEALHQHPVLMQRPIVVIDDNKAVIARPPENINAIC